MLAALAWLISGQLIIGGRPKHSTIYSERKEFQTAGRCRFKLKQHRDETISNINQTSGFKYSDAVSF
jgi:hypothetical protein